MPSPAWVLSDFEDELDLRSFLYAGLEGPEVAVFTRPDVHLIVGIRDASVLPLEIAIRRGRGIKLKTLHALMMALGFEFCFADIGTSTEYFISPERDSDLVVVPRLHFDDADYVPQRAIALVLENLEINGE